MLLFSLIIVSSTTEVKWWEGDIRRINIEATAAVSRPSLGHGTACSAGIFV